MNRALTGMTGTSYSDWSGKTSNSTAVYKGQSAGGNDAIQLRSNNSNSGIVTTASGGTVRKVVVTWGSGNASGRTLEIYGKNTAYSAATDLYGNNKGTSLGTIVYGTSIELEITGNYEYIGLRSKSGAMYIAEIQITWESGNGGGETPTPDPTPDPEPEPDQPGTGGDPVTVTMSSFTATAADMDSVISYTTAKGGGTSNPAVNEGAIRLYQNANGNPGGNITVTAKDGYTITSVVIGSSMGTKVAYQVDGSSRSSTENLAANGKYTINQEGQSITIHCMGTTSSSRLYVNYLSVTYK